MLRTTILLCNSSRYMNKHGCTPCKPNWIHNYEKQQKNFKPIGWKKHLHTVLTLWPPAPLHPQFPLVMTILPFLWPLPATWQSLVSRDTPTCSKTSKTRNHGNSQHRQYNRHGHTLVIHLIIFCRAPPYVGHTPLLSRRKQWRLLMRVPTPLWPVSIMLTQTSYQQEYLRTTDMLTLMQLALRPIWAHVTVVYFGLALSCGYLIRSLRWQMPLYIMPSATKLFSYPKRGTWYFEVYLGEWHWGHVRY